MNKKQRECKPGLSLFLTKIFCGYLVLCVYLMCFLQNQKHFVTIISIHTKRWKYIKEFIHQKESEMWKKEDIYLSLTKRKLEQQRSGYLHQKILKVFRSK